MPAGTVADTDTYAKIVEKLRDNACVLFLGPSAVLGKDTDGSWRPLSEMCARQLAQAQGLTLTAQEPYELSYVCNRLVDKRYAEMNLQRDVAKYYQGLLQTVELHPMLEKLADLPFRLIIQTTPDNAITLMYDQLGKPYNSTFFYNAFDNAAPAFQFDFEKNRSVPVYNLFGRYDRDNSLPLTNSQQLDYISRVVGGQQHEKIPDALINSFKRFRHHLFLGFDFDDWKLRLLLYTLYSSVKTGIEPYAYRLKTQQPADMEAQLFFSGQFGMQFPSPDVETFVDNLVTEYKGSLQQPTYGKNRAKVLILHNEGADQEGYDLLAMPLKQLNFEVLSLGDSVGKGDVAEWLENTLSTTDVVLVLLTDTMLADPNIGFSYMMHLEAKHKPKELFVLPIKLRDFASADLPASMLTRLWPYEENKPLLDRDKKADFLKEILGVVNRYVTNTLKK